MMQSIHGPILREEFLERLDADGGAPLQISRGKNQDNFTTIISLPKTDQISYLFCETSYSIPGIHQNDNFSFCGLYLRQDHSLRLADHRLTCAVDGLTETERMDRDDLRRHFCKQVNRRVEELIADDRENLTITKLNCEETKRRLDYYRQYGARDKAIRTFFSDETPDFRFRSDYELKDRSEDFMLACLQNPDTIVEAEARQHIKDHQEQLLLTFLENDALRGEYTALLQDEENPIHRMKAITDAVRDSGAKTVTVTVVKPEGELTFKAAADSLTGHRNYYSSYDIPAQDRREFEQMFGKYADYHAEDITRITYGRNTIYEAPSAPVEDLEQDDGPSMTRGGM